ncbi:hypothetical protein OKA05_11340 [Luteolibacter arcticus]|uniref:Glycoside hydrolase family 38 N-terminal domain-containing protein n=1 Tax=Luteolibacter arcticus TaxID=1581411 RepID=A0ABT3GI01_9BACT|nr:hypothetical protein [Luteolibacter arcticus]MCW1923148.1 hypothetical protein [Luteolibacter arcticus]
MLLLPALRITAVEVGIEAVSSAEISITSSSSYSGIQVVNVINGSGLNAASLQHDNEINSATMWHSAAGAAPSKPDPALPVGKAWLRLDLAQAKPLGSCRIWNHNQTGMTDRGFRHVRAFVSSDGSTFKPALVAGKEVFEIPRASGGATENASFSLPLAGQMTKSLVLLANDSWGSEFLGLAEVQLLTRGKQVDATSAPAPTSVTVRGFPFRVEAEERWRRQVEVAFDAPLFVRGLAKVTCGGASVETAVNPLSGGQKHFTFDLPPGKGNTRASTEKVTISIKAGRFQKTIETTVERPKEWPDLEEVIVTFKCHLDIGYTHTVPEVVEKYRASDMDHLLAVFDQTKDLPKDDRFSWMLPAWAMEVVLDPQQTPQRRARLEQAVKDGRLTWHALPFTLESEASDAEEVVRGLGFGTRMAKRFGIPLPTDAKQTDMPEQAWILPTVLKNAGINFLHIGANDGSKPMSEWSKIPTLSWWEGPDGSRVLLGISPRYGWANVQPPAGWPHKSWLAFFVLGDNAGPPPANYVKSVLDEARKQLPGVRIRFGRPSEFADAIIQEEKERPTLPVVRGDMPDTWTHGQMSCPSATAIHRRAATNMGSLGILDTSLRGWGMAPNPVATPLAEAYALGGFYGEHTWGINGAYFRGTFGEAWQAKYEKGDYQKFEDTYEYHMDYGRKAGGIADTELAARMKILAQNVKADGLRAVLFNPLPWARSAQVELQLPENMAGRALSKVVDLATGKAVPFALDGRTLNIAALDLPPGGYRTYGIVPQVGASKPAALPPATLKGNTLETSHFIATFDLERGGIASLEDKATGRELVDSSQHVLGQFLHERFSLTQVQNFVNSYGRTEAGSWVWGDFGKGGMPNEKTSPFLARTPQGWTAEVAASPMGETVTLSAIDPLGLAKGYGLTFTFPRDRNCVDIEWRVDRKTPDPIPEGGWLCLPFKVKEPCFRVGRVGGTIDPLKDIIFGANRRMLSVDRGITVRAGDTGAGMAAASADLPLWSLGEPGLWQYSPAYKPTNPALFVNLYNNMWNTNYPLWIKGTWKASLRLWPVAEDATEEQALFTPSWEVRQPVVAGCTDGMGGNLAVAQSGISLSRKGVRVTAFCPNPDGTGTVLRLWEQAGGEGAVTITLPKGFKATKAHPVDLRGQRAGDSMKIEGGQFTSSLGAWAPKSWVLE